MTEFFRNRNQRKLEHEQDDVKAEKLGSKKGTKDAYCTECQEWYDTSNDKELNRHAH